MFINNKRGICLKQRIFFGKESVVMKLKFDLWSINDICNVGVVSQRTPVLILSIIIKFTDGMISIFKISQ